MICLTVSNFYWLGDTPEQQCTDLCAHGHLRFAFPGIVLEDDCTVSASAMQFLRTLTEDHIAKYDDEQMMPCCGHFMIPSDDKTRVTITGCPNGTDFDVLHRGDSVIIRTKTAEYPLDPSEYPTAVLALVEQVEAFYQESPLRALDTHDQFSRDGYDAFWHEWYDRKRQTK